mmetsp:Transcript_19024/g.52384  ORF Transcript_19024/g.52384 Transcript_19024/m.52384 type:complete len:245 (-) Transcript_19024:782-1516(-)
MDVQPPKGRRHERGKALMTFPCRAAQPQPALPHSAANSAGESARDAASRSGLTSSAAGRWQTHEAMMSDDRSTASMGLTLSSTTVSTRPFANPCVAANTTCSVASSSGMAPDLVRASIKSKARPRSLRCSSARSVRGAAGGANSDGWARSVHSLPALRMDGRSAFPTSKVSNLRRERHDNPASTLEPHYSDKLANNAFHHSLAVHLRGQQGIVQPGLRALVWLPCVARTVALMMRLLHTSRGRG